MPASQWLATSTEVGFEKTTEGLRLAFGRAEICIKQTGEIQLKNQHASVCLSAFGKVNIKSRQDITINSDHHICLNTK